jgi:hypothetical protein
MIIGTNTNENRKLKLKNEKKVYLKNGKADRKVLVVFTCLTESMGHRIEFKNYTQWNKISSSSPKYICLLEEAF